MIPQEMRKDVKQGEKFVIIKAGKQIILEKVSEFDENIKDDFEFARRTEKVFSRIEKGNFKKMSGKEFFEEIKKW